MMLGDESARYVEFYLLVSFRGRTGKRASKNFNLSNLCVSREVELNRW